MTDLAFLYRADKTNVGDWFCPPFLYFPFKSFKKGDVIDENFDFSGIKTVILGGGGLGTKWFDPHLERLYESGVDDIIVWGAGIDIVSDKKNLLKNQEYDLYGHYFEGLSDVGIRVYSPEQKFRYVPCASCMHELFDKYRDVKPQKLIGFYNHKRAPVKKSNIFNRSKVNDNNGNDLESKLKFLSTFEYIVTNSYHGVYWATLLNRKVIVVPFKSGLLSFKHKPAVSWNGKITDDLLHEAVVYEDALEDSRAMNQAFFEDMSEKYSLV